MSIVGTIGLGWRSLRNHLADLLFPPRCLGCRRVDTWLCADCLGQIPCIEPPFCTRCGDRVEGGEICARCQTSPLHINRIRSVAHFEGTVRHAMHHLKYRGHTALAEPLGDLLAAYWTGSFCRSDDAEMAPSVSTCDDLFTNWIEAEGDLWDQDHISPTRQTSV